MALEIDEGRRALIERRRAARRGRPKGSKISLLEHPRRFDTALWLTLTRAFDIGPTVASNVVAGLLSTRPIDAGTVENVLLCLSTGIDHATLRGRADRIGRRAQEAVEAASPEEMAWLVDSGAALMQLWTFGPDSAHAAYVLDALQARGWGPTLASIAERLVAALSTNLPPVMGPASRKALRLAGAVRLAEVPEKA